MSELYRAQKLFGSAFHPDTGDLQTLPGRMCANVYGSTLMCGGMMVFYRLKNEDYNKGNTNVLFIFKVKFWCILLAMGKSVI